MLAIGAGDSCRRAVMGQSLRGDSTSDRCQINPEAYRAMAGELRMIDADPASNFEHAAAAPLLELRKAAHKRLQAMACLLGRGEKFRTGEGRAGAAAAAAGLLAPEIGHAGFEGVRCGRLLAWRALAGHRIPAATARRGAAQAQVRPWARACSRPACVKLPASWESAASASTARAKASASNGSQ